MTKYIIKSDNFSQKINSSTFPAGCFVWFDDENIMHIGFKSEYTTNGIPNIFNESGEFFCKQNRKGYPIRIEVDEDD